MGGPRVVSLVPSWTETLIEAGVAVVGRTRYCVHPRERVEAIPAVGGTKQVRWEAVAALDPDLVVMDEEENTAEMAAACPYPRVVTRVRSAADAAAACSALAQATGARPLAALAARWRRLAARPRRRRPAARLPGVVAWWRRPRREPAHIVYLVWRRPWMAAGGETFIADALRIAGLGDRLWPAAGRYPEIDLATLDPAATLLLAATEPYPFARRRAEMQALPFPCALVDGEAWCWYGVRALRFLEAATAA
ncbi:helical backbone metal receptor [Inmirania thermothiophila]|uniref:helical backbone metal receptor n=1 Tax=Inmirania thermothiophila TaxID=1750597 RepID=UPI0014751FD6|nr:helical backbone metal receptor [Inmirania thermothiophila]